MAWLAAIVVLLVVGGIVLILLASGPLGTCSADPNQPQMNCAPNNLIWLDVAMLTVGVLAVVVTPFAWIVREGMAAQRAKTATLERLEQTRALDPLRGRTIVGGSPELFEEVALRERLEQTGTPGSAEIVSVNETSTDSDFLPKSTYCLRSPLRVGRPTRSDGTTPFPVLPSGD